MKKKTALYVGNFSFPLGNAAGKRVYANGKMLRELGYEVIYIGVDRTIRYGTPLDSTECEYDSFKYYSFPYPGRDMQWINYNSVFRSLVDFIERNHHIRRIDMIIYYGSPSLSLFITKLIKYSRKNDIRIVSDCVDWLTVKTKNPIFNFIKWVDNTYQKSHLNKKTDGVIVISKYLEKYYSEAGLKTVVIPPLSPTKYKTCLRENKQDNKKIISYAGLPFRKGKQVADLNALKDRIDKTIGLLYDAKCKGSKFAFNIYGFTKDDYLCAIPSHKDYIAELGEDIKFHGLVPNEEVVNSIAKSDFTILIRDVNRDTTAGFPTKVSESISCGTPVITTRTSDLDEYIIEGKNGYFLDMEDEKACLIKLRDILNISNEQVDAMKSYCIMNNLFSYERFINDLETFIIQIKN